MRYVAQSFIVLFVILRVLHVSRIMTALTSTAVHRLRKTTLPRSIFCFLRSAYSHSLSIRALAMSARVVVAHVGYSALLGPSPKCHGRDVSRCVSSQETSIAHQSDPRRETKATIILRQPPSVAALLAASSDDCTAPPPIRQRCFYDRRTCGEGSLRFVDRSVDGFIAASTNQEALHMHHSNYHQIPKFVP
jgi:hypothetical protein